LNGYLSFPEERFMPIKKALKELSFRALIIIEKWFISP